MHIIPLQPWPSSFSKGIDCSFASALQAIYGDQHKSTNSFGSFVNMYARVTGTLSGVLFGGSHLEKMSNVIDIPLRNELVKNVMYLVLF